VLSEQLPESLQQDFLNAALELINNNVSIITSTCGFLSTLQRSLADLSNTPVICSSLALLPLLSSVHGGDEYLGVVTFNADTLNKNHFGNVQPGGIEGLQPGDSLRRVIEQDLSDINQINAQSEVIAACNRLIVSKPTTRALILECTNLSPFKQAIRAHMGLPVYDIVDAIHWLLESQAL